MTKLKYDSYIQKGRNLKTATKKESNDLRFLRRYDIIEVNGITKLIHPVTDQESIKNYVFDEELFGVLNEGALELGTGQKGFSNLCLNWAPDAHIGERREGKAGLTSTEYNTLLAGRKRGF